MILTERKGNMTLGEKIKKLRNNANISQEDLAEQIGVSRQIVTKWENDAGLPDIQNLKKIAKVFDISIDELLDYKDELFEKDILEEKYSLEGITKTGKCRSKEEQYVVNRFGGAISIYSLLRKKKWSLKKNIFWFIIEPSFSPEMEDFLENGVNTICLVEEKDNSYIVILKKGIMKIIKLKVSFSDKKLDIDGYEYKKLYKIK